MTNLRRQPAGQTLGWKHVSNWAESTHASVRQTEQSQRYGAQRSDLCREQFGELTLDF